MSSNARAYVCIVYTKTNFLENITWSELGKQNIQAKKVYWFLIWLSKVTKDL